MYVYVYDVYIQIYTFTYTHIYIHIKRYCGDRTGEIGLTLSYCFLVLGVRLYKILFYFKALLWESIIL